MLTVSKESICTAYVRQNSTDGNEEMEAEEVTLENRFLTHNCKTKSKIH